MEDLKNIIQEMQKYRIELQSFNPSDDCILQCATDIFNSQNINRQGNKAIQSPLFVPATEPQMKYLKDKKIPHEKKISKQEAYQIIKQHKGGGK